MGITRHFFTHHYIIYSTYITYYHINTEFFKNLKMNFKTPINFSLYRQPLDALKNHLFDLINHSTINNNVSETTPFDVVSIVVPQFIYYRDFTFTSPFKNIFDYLNQIIDYFNLSPEFLTIWCILLERFIQSKRVSIHCINAFGIIFISLYCIVKYFFPIQIENVLRFNCLGNFQTLLNAERNFLFILNNNIAVIENDFYDFFNRNGLILVRNIPTLNFNNIQYNINIFCNERMEPRFGNRPMFDARRLYNRFNNNFFNRFSNHTMQTIGHFIRRTGPALCGMKIHKIIENNDVFDTLSKTEVNPPRAYNDIHLIKNRRFFVINRMYRQMMNDSLNRLFAMPLFLLTQNRQIDISILIGDSFRNIDFKNLPLLTCNSEKTYRTMGLEWSENCFFESNFLLCVQIFGKNSMFVKFYLELNSMNVLHRYIEN